jgi:hypothetical protein
MILLEGGNVFPDVDPFSKEESADVLAKAQSMMPQGIDLIPVGSAGHKASSGDMDLMVDETAMLEFFKVKTAKEARQNLKTFFQDRGIDSALTGINVHIKVPNGDKFAQADIMFVKDAGSVSKFHQHDYSIESTPFKGVHKHILLSSIAKETRNQSYPNGLMWSGFQGLFGRDENGKKGEFITHDADEVAKILLGAQASSGDLGNVERIIDALPGKEKNPKIQHALADENWPGNEGRKPEDIKEGSSEWFSWMQGVVEGTHGRYWCSTDKKWKDRKSPKQSRGNE